MEVFMGQYPADHPNDHLYAGRENRQVWKKSKSDLLYESIEKIFPVGALRSLPHRKGLGLFLKGTKYLVNNLVISLALAIWIDFALHGLDLFRSFRMIIISLIPNLLPSADHSGAYGLFGRAD